MREGVMMSGLGIGEGEGNDEGMEVLVREGVMMSEGGMVREG